jgi:hypothetical protein
MAVKVLFYFDFERLLAQGIPENPYVWGSTSGRFLFLTPMGINSIIVQRSHATTYSS